MKKYKNSISINIPLSSQQVFINVKLKITVGDLLPDISKHASQRNCPMHLYLLVLSHPGPLSQLTGFRIDPCSHGKLVY